ncbi:MAG: division/cell wall cluster transcriptional repressor MraZ [Pseudomonadota bacterium]|nr:division/cell wall cluster transcriptional repressor MraZ [Pseudomonadota bacterium]|tara:strand:- start:428 stop:919 length:492 start_codon:yes stop_codon:yes gene_type:complete
MALFVILWRIMENLFKGIHNLSLDSKGRLGIPVKYRDNIIGLVKGAMVITIDTEEKCLLLYPSNFWSKIQDKISKLPSFNKNARRIQRLLVGHAEDIDVDSNGRILISKPLREYASLTKKVILIGQGEKFEIWDQGTWSQNVEKWREEVTSSDDAEALSDISI